MRHHVDKLTATHGRCGAMLAGQIEAVTNRDFVQCPGCLREIAMDDARTAAIYLQKNGYTLDYSDDIFMGVSKPGGPSYTMTYLLNPIPEEIWAAMKLINEAPEPVTADRRQVTRRKEEGTAAEAAVALLVEMVAEFPGLLNGHDDVNGGDLVDWLNQHQTFLQQLAEGRS